MPKPIQNPRLGQALQREYNLVGRVDPSLDEVVVPVVLAGDVRSVVAPNSREAVLRLSIAAVLAEVPYFRIETPPGTLARINAIQCNVATAAAVSFHWGSLSAAPATLQDAVTFTDGRRRLAGALPGVRLGGDTLAAVPAPANLHYTTRVDADQAAQLAVPPSTIGQPASEDFLEIYVHLQNVSVTFSVWVEEFPFQTSNVV